MADLIIVKRFIESGDLNSEFIKRVEVAGYEEAITIREANPDPPTTIDVKEQSRQQWALGVFANPLAEAKRMLPALAVAANNAGLIDSEGVVTATDAQIRNTVGGLVEEYIDYVAAVV